MMRKSFLFLIAFVTLSVTAQSQFGYVSYREMVKSLPEYNIVEAHLDELQAKYEAEIARADREFNQKYVDFIESQSQFPDNIRIKRHKELQELMEKIHSLQEGGEPCHARGSCRDDAPSS